MNYDYEIYTDATVDIDTGIAQQYGLRYIPMEYMLGDELFRINEPESDQTMTAFYESLRSRVKTQTSQINPYTYIEVFRPYVISNRPVIYISLSGGLSSTVRSAQNAVRLMKMELGNAQIEVVDSFGATIGMGLLVEAALRNRGNGMGFKENAAWLRSHALNVIHQFKVVDLFYLMRGGRINAASAAIGSALNLRPLLIINNEGRLVTVAKKRGDSLAAKFLVSEYEERRDPMCVPEMKNVVYICHAGCPDSADDLKAQLLKVNPDIEFRTCPLGPVIGAHTGPDMLAMTFFGRSRE